MPARAAATRADEPPKKKRKVQESAPSTGAVSAGSASDKTAITTVSEWASHSGAAPHSHSAGAVGSASDETAGITVSESASHTGAASHSHSAGSASAAETTVTHEFTSFEDLMTVLKYWNGWLGENHIEVINCPGHVRARVHGNRWINENFKHKSKDDSRSGDGRVMVLRNKKSAPSTGALSAGSASDETAITTVSEWASHSGAAPHSHSAGEIRTEAGLYRSFIRKKAMITC